MECTFKHIKKTKKIKNGHYFFMSVNYLLDYIVVEIKNKNILIKNKKDISIIEESYNFNNFDFERYSHFYKYIPSENPENWYIEYERLVEIKTLKDKDEIIKYYFFDTKSKEFECYFDKDGLFHYNQVEVDFRYLSKHKTGWHDLKIPNNFKVKSGLVLGIDEIEQVKFIFNHFYKHRDLNFPEIQKTNRGWGYIDLTDYNEIPIEIKESSIATESRIWFGRIDSEVHINNKIFKMDDFITEIKLGNIPEINNINEPCKSILCSEMSELSIYHIEKLLEIFNKK